MDTFLLNPNLVYLFLVVGFSLTFVAILAPGTGILEVGALFLLILAAWGVFNLPLNYWALILLVVGVLPPVFALRKTGKDYYLWISAASLVIGSVYLLKGERWFQPAIHLGLALAVSALVGGLFWITTRKTLEADAAPPSHDLNALIGALGEAKSEVYYEGSVQVQKELWTARSNRPIEAGAQVRVIAREGFVLVVEKV